MSQVQKHILTSGGKTFHYVKFPSVLAFEDFVNEQFAKLSGENRRVWQDVFEYAQDVIQRETDWYGLPSPPNIQALEEHNRYLGMHMLSKIKGKFDKHLRPYLNHLEENVMPRPRLAYNDRGLGVFSFERAAMGMFKNPRIDVSTSLNTTTSQLKIELGQGDIQTTTKKVFTHFENRNNSMPSMRLYIGAGANANVKGDALLYIGLACRELVNFLEQRGVPVEVNILIGSSWSDYVVNSVIKLKSFDQRLDQNRLLLLSSDPRYFRYKGFKGLIALSNFFQLQIPSGLGRITPELHSEFQTVLDKEGFVFEQSYSLDQATKEISSIINKYENVRRLMEGLFQS